MKAFVDLLSVLEQNPNVEWFNLIKRLDIAEDFGEDLSEIDEISVGETQRDNELTTFKL